MTTSTSMPLRARSRRFESTVLHILGLGMMFVGVGLLGCAGIEAATDGGAVPEMIISAGVFGIGGWALWRGTRVGRVATTTVFSAVAVTWIVISIIGALPYLMAGTMAQPGNSFLVELSDALFESASGFSCTGSTVITDLPDLGDSNHRIGRGMLFWRQLTQWYGGMGIVLLVLAVLPALGVRAVGFMVAESPGVSADRLVPRISETARRLWLLYVGVTVAIALAYLVTGMSFYDAWAHAVATAATGGFSPYNDSIGEFNSVPIEMAVVVAMLVCGASFSLHYRALTGDRLAHVKNSEFRWYMAFFAAVAALVVGALWIDGGVGASTIRYGAFNSATLVTSTGFGNARGAGSAGDFTTWIPAAQVALLVAMVVGGSTGSTAGGIKITRFRVLGSQARMAVRAARHPRAVLPLKTGSTVVPERTAEHITGFIVIWLICALFGTLFASIRGTDLTTAVSGAVSALGNMGPSLNASGPAATFVDGFDSPTRLLLAALMIIGRLELFAVLLLFARPLRHLQPRASRLISQR
ncbi:MAG: TrkH family potassium uptake protein [Acidimicrobiales bacterium]